MDLYSAASRLSRPFVFREEDRDQRTIHGTLGVAARGIIGDGLTCALVRVDGAQQRKITDEAGMNQVAAEMGYDPAVFGPATKEWISRMGKSMVVGQEFRRRLGY